MLPLYGKELRMVNKFFSITEDNTGRYVIYVFGFRIRFLKSSTKEERKKYEALFTCCDVNNIPKAVGTLRDIQLANRGMLKCLDEICSKYNINYWLDFGTLLGAVRHRGFIPWDDDVDLGMMRDDYDKFAQILEKEKETYPDLYIDYCFNNVNKCFVKMKHRKSENLFVDIFPYDFYYKKLNQDEKQELSQKIHKISHSKKRFFLKEESLLKHFKKNTNKILEGYDLKKEKEPAIFMGIDYPHGHGNKVYDYEQIFPLQKLEFEDCEFLVPNKPHEILKSIYGDYTSIPKGALYPRHSNSFTLLPKEKEILEKMKNF